jgi:hypothetical protein
MSITSKPTFKVYIAGHLHQGNYPGYSVDPSLKWEEYSAESGPL